MTNNLLIEVFIQAKARSQPYINLTNKILSLEELGTSDILKFIADLQLGSLYFSASNITLDDKLANFIAKVNSSGIREILLFSIVNEKNISTEEFNSFLEKYKIHINFRMAEVNDADFNTIRDDIYGKKDLLAIDHIEDYKLIYKDGFSLPILNSKKSNEIIIKNHNELRDSKLDKNSFELKEPEYIQKSEDGAKKRIKDIKLLDKKHFQAEVSHQIDFSEEVSQEMSKEQEIDLDLEQADYKFNKFEAQLKAQEVQFSMFFNQDIKKHLSSDESMWDLIGKIFNSHNKIKFITKDALNLIVKNYFFFASGIDTNNMPIGLALKDGIIFASSQRPASMKINEFTVKLDDIAPFISSPIEYSWLKYASKGSISLNDIYGTEDAPELYGYEQHPAIHSIIKDIMLDIPENYENYRYNEQDAENESFSPPSLIFDKVKTDVIHLDKRFGQVMFSNLSAKDLIRLDEIYLNLQQRGIEEIFVNIITSNHILDGGFLFEEKTTLFLIKLFKEILPLSEDHHKILFFKETLLNIKLKKQSNLQDIFESLHGFYSNFSELLIKQEASSIYKEKAFAKAITIIKTYIPETTSLKAILGRLNNILEANEVKGGNLAEQLEYLASAEGKEILLKPEFYFKAKEIGLNVIHKSLSLDKEISKEFEEDFSSSKLINKIYNQDNSKTVPYYDYYHDESLTSSIRYFSSLASHQRASIDTYAKYFYNLDTPDLNKNSACNSRDYNSKNIDISLKTIDYVEANIFGYSYAINNSPAIFYGGKSVDFTKILQDPETAKNFLIISVNSDDIEIINRHNNKTAEINFSEYNISPDEINLARSFLVNNTNIDGKIYKLSEKELGFFSEINLEAIIDKLKDVFQNEEDIDTYYGKTPFIAKTNEGYDLYLKNGFNDFTLLDKSSISEKLNNKILESISLGDKKIILLPSEVNGSIFENYANKGYLTNKEDIEKQANNDREKLEKLLVDAPKEIVKDFCYPGVSIITKNTNLVSNFTTQQAGENVKLLSLNLISSSGKYYDVSYPDGEFDSYISLFNTLFSDVKIYEEQKIALIELNAKENFNYKTSSISYSKINFTPLKEVKEKEAEHKKIIDNFLLTFKENPEFNFGQVLALGLVRNEDISLGLKTIEKAKTLLVYNEYFTQITRTILATSVTENNGLEELNLRAKSVAKIINKLADIHHIISHNGKYPENLVFFASVFSKDSEITDEKVKTFISKIDNLNQELKSSLLNAFAKCKLPFDFGKIAQNNFPILSLEVLDNSTLLEEIIEKAKEDFVSYEFETRFNDLGLTLMENALIDLSDFEHKYDVKISKDIKNLSFKQLKAKILETKDFVQKEFDITKDKKEILDISKNLIQIMLKTITKQDAGSQDLSIKITNLLFDYKQPLENQLLNIEVNKKILDLLFKDKNDAYKEKFIDLLTGKEEIPKENLHQILTFLKELKQESLEKVNLTIFDLLEKAGNEIIGKYFDSFVLSTNAYLKGNISIELSDLYLKIKNLADAKYSNFNIKEIIEYCISNNDFNSIDIYTKLSGESDNIGKIVEFLTNISPNQLQKINNDLGTNIKTLLSLKDVLKIELIAEIVLEYSNLINKNQYSLLIEKARSNDQDYINLLHNFLITKAEISEEDKIKTVFENINSIKDAQVIFSKENTNRFTYSEERVKAKISEIKFLNEDKSLLENNQNKIYDYFKNIIEKSKAYSATDSNILHDKVIELKHNRSLAKDKYANYVSNIDLEFLAISLEMMFRETGKFPRDAQVIVIINSILQKGHIIEQIATGEGKSITTALHASYLWFTGQTVDVVTSNRELALKDLLEFYTYYQKLGVTNAKEVIKPDSEIAIYKKSGINYSTAADLALFRANREFSSDLDDKTLNTDVSLICDEIDFTLTSEINFKLAIPIVNTNQQETRILLEYINDFLKTNHYKNDISEKDDVQNLKMFLTHQFKLYNSSYKYPLGEIQKQELKEGSKPIADKLYKLHKALEKAYKDDDLFHDLIDSALYAQSLEENVQYILPKLNLGNQEKLLKAVPIIKDQPSYGTNFGDGVQSFLHLIIEKKYPEYQNKLDISMPLSTIFNISPKNFFDYYRLTEGKIIGLTGTAGDKDTIEEFKTTNKIVSFDFPRYKKNLKIIEYKETADSLLQEQLMFEIIGKENLDRPIIIFAQNAKEAEKIYSLLNELNLSKNIDLYSGSLKDTKPNEVEIRKVAGDLSHITVTTPMLGRGTDFDTSYKKGFLAINLCTDITESTLKQIEGRVARAGNEGKIISIFNKDIFEDNIESFMRAKALKENDLQKINQPLTDILQYFNKKNQDQKFNAIKTNKFITKEWKSLLKEQGEKSLLDLKAELIAKVKEKYPNVTKELDSYLENLEKDNDYTNHVNYHASYVLQDYTNQEKLFYNIIDYRLETPYEKFFISLGKSSIFTKIEEPNDDLGYKDFYNKVAKANAVTMLTHAMTIEKESIKFKDGDNIHYIEGEGSSGNLMLDEFKKSFNAYKKLVNSVEVNEISKIIDNFGDVKDIDVAKLGYGKYQAINIETKFDSSSSHAESLITDGKFLFWINRGGDTSKGKPGIKIFKIIKSLDQVKELFEFLKIPQSQTKTRSKIYDLLREDGDKNIPEYVQIEMKPQKIGNCGWTQTKGMLKAAAIVAELGELDDFPDVSSSNWQKILKDSEDIYKDFTSYDRIKRLEAVLYAKDKDFPLEFLDEEEKIEIDNRREFLENPILPELLIELEKKLLQTIGKYKNTIYEDKAREILTKLKLEVAIESEAGEALIRSIGKENSIALLSKYQKDMEGDFKNFQKIYKEISEGAIKDKSYQDHSLKQILENIVETKYNISNLDSFIDTIRSVVQECFSQQTENCMIEKIDIIFSGDVCTSQDVFVL